MFVENVKKTVFYETIYSSKYWCKLCQNVLYDAKKVLQYKIIIAVNYAEKVLKDWPLTEPSAIAISLKASTAKIEPRLTRKLVKLFPAFNFLIWKRK